MKIAYETLHELPLKRYIDCVVDNNLYALLRTPISAIFYPEKRLKTLWSKLQEEYRKLSGNKEYEVKKAAIDELNDMKLRVYLYSNALQLISDYDDMLNATEYLEKEGFSGKREFVVKRVTAEIKMLKIQIESKEIQLSKDKVENNDKKVTREDYAKTIIATNKNGYKVDYDTTVADFIVAMNMQKEESKRMEQQLKKRR